MDIGSKLRYFRTKQNLSQEKLAMLLDIDRNSYMRLETGEVNLSWERLEQIANILKLDVWEILAHNEKQVVYVNATNQGTVTNQGYVTQNISQPK